MVNAHLLAVTNAGTSPVNAGSAGCKNCPGSSASSEAPSFASLLDAQTNEGPPLSDQQQMQNDPSASLAPTSSADGLPAATLLALAANDTPADGQQAPTGDSLGAPATPDQLLADLTDKPAPPSIEGQTTPGFGTHISATMGQIEQGNPAISSTLVAAQDNLAQPATPTNQLQEALGPLADRQNLAQALAGTQDNGSQANTMNAANLPSTGTVAGAVGEGTATPNGQTLRDVTQALNDNARPPTALGQSIAGQATGDQMASAKGGALTDEAQLARQTSEADAKAAAQQGNGPAKTATGEIAAVNGEAAKKQAATTSTLTSDATPPTKIDRDAPRPQTTSTTPGQAPPPAIEAKPTSLMDRLKPLAQAAFSLQGMEGAQTSAKTADGLVPAISMTATGELARPGGITGLAPTNSNPALPPVPLNNIAVHIASQAGAGHQRFTIRLDPPELGRIDIRLEIGRDGQTLTHLAVEKPETLDLLRQDQRALERALNNAGLDSRNGSLSYSLRDENQNKRQAGEQQRDGSAGADEPTIEQGDEPVITRTIDANARLDISI